MPIMQASLTKDSVYTWYVFNLRVNCCPKKDRIRFLKETDCWENILHRLLSNTEDMLSVKKLCCNFNFFVQFFSMTIQVTNGK